jgi:hypothetical protein
LRAREARIEDDAGYHGRGVLAPGGFGALDGFIVVHEPDTSLFLEAQSSERAPPAAKVAMRGGVPY